MYKIVEVKDGEWAVNEYLEHDFLDTMKKLGHKVLRFNDNKCHRAELQGHPIFDNLTGPQWDGNGMIRYENSNAYKWLFV